MSGSLSAWVAIRLTAFSPARPDRDDALDVVPVGLSACLPACVPVGLSLSVSVAVCRCRCLSLSISLSLCLYVCLRWCVSLGNDLRIRTHACNLQFVGI